MVDGTLTSGQKVNGSLPIELRPSFGRELQAHDALSQPVTTIAYEQRRVKHIGSTRRSFCGEEAEDYVQEAIPSVRESWVTKSIGSSERD